MGDRIELSGIRALGTIGALAEERERAQPFEVDLAIELDVRRAGRSDQLADALDYGVPVAVAHRVLTTERHQLLERVAERIAEDVLALPEVDAVEVVVRKLRVPVPHDLRAAGVRVHRRKADLAAPPGPTSEAYVALGSNLGDRRAFLRYAVRELGAVTVSPLYESDPVGGPEQGPYLNMVVRVETPLDPFQLLDRCLAIEAGAGRERRERWGPRTLDLDVLLFDEVEIRSPRLTLPHPRMWERRFVLQPLADLAPALVPADWDERLPKGGIRRAGDLEA